VSNGDTRFSSETANAFAHGVAVEKNAGKELKKPKKASKSVKKNSPGVQVSSNLPEASSKLEAIKASKKSATSKSSMVY
jgi:hypothetical protein